MSTFAGIWLALVAVASTHLLTTAAAQQLRASLPGAMMTVSHQIRYPQPTEADYFRLRQRWRAGEFPAVAAMVPMVEGHLGDYRVLGFDPLALSGAGDAGVAGAGLLSGNGVLAHVGLGALDGDLLLGPQRLEVVGRFGHVDQPSNLIVADIALAQRLLDSRSDSAGTGWLTAIGIVARNQPAAFETALERAFPGITSQTLAAMQVGEFTAEVVGDQARQRFTGAMLFNLGALSLLSALVAGFLAYQSTVNGLRHRAVLLARLDVMGVPGRVVVLAVLLESLVLALLAVPLALLAGRGVAAGLMMLTLGAGETGSVLAPSLVVDHWVLAKVLLLAVLTVLVSGVLAHRFVRGERWRMARFWIASASTLLVVAGLSRDAAGVTGALLAVLGCCLLAVITIGAGVRGLMAVAEQVGRRLPAIWLVNLRSIGAGFPEVSAAMGALLIASGTAMGISLMVESFRLAFEDMLDQRLRADLVLSSPEGFAESDLTMLTERPGVARLGRYADGEAQLSKDGTSGQVVLHFVDLDGWEANRYGGAVLPVPHSVFVNEQAARRFGLGAGETLAVRNRGEAVELSVAGVFSDYGEPRPRLVLSLDWAQKLGPVTVDRIGLVVEPASRNEVVTSLVDGNWEVVSQAEIRDFAERVFARTFRITDALTALALLVAAAGLYNALSALDVKRGDEYRLLAMLGFDGAELRRMALGQTMVLAGLVMLLALPLGAVVAWILCNVLNPRAFGWSITFHWSAVPVVSAVAAGMAAALVAGLLGRRGQW